jgi:hypothetical protein
MVLAARLLVPPPPTTKKKVEKLAQGIEPGGDPRYVVNIHKKNPKKKNPKP